VTDDAPAWAIRFESRAERDLRRLDPPVARRVMEALDRVLALDQSVDLRRLQGSDEWRLRVGDWRVRLRLDFDDRVVIVARVLPRGRAYDR
jgi:mRNA interferase RelE/StbE